MRNKVFTLLFLVVLLPSMLVGCEPTEVDSTKGVVADKTLCDFSRGPCEVESANLTIYLSLLPDFTPSEEPINVKIATSEKVADVAMKLEGRDMFMGVIPVQLTQVDERDFSGSMIFGSCSSGYMVWRATVSFVHDGEQKHVWFDFLADADKAR